MKEIKTIQYKPTPIRGGYTDCILQIDLTSDSITEKKLPPDFKDKYVGGRGYALKLIWDATSGETRYDSPENVLVMASGPLCGDPRFPGSGKFIVGTISPLTDTFIDSNIGGYFAPLFKLCGFDALAVTGIANEDVVIIVDGDEEPGPAPVDGQNETDDNTIMDWLPVIIAVVVVILGAILIQMFVIRRRK